MQKTVFPGQAMGDHNSVHTRAVPVCWVRSCGVGERRESGLCLTRDKRWEAADCVDRTERMQLQRHAKLVAIQTEACPAVCSTQPANDLHALLCAIHTVSRCHSVSLEKSVQLSGLPRVFVHALAFSSTPSHAAAAAHALCSLHHSSRVWQLSDSRCSAAHRSRTEPSRHGHQTTSR